MNGEQGVVRELKCRPSDDGGSAIRDDKQEGEEGDGILFSWQYLLYYLVGLPWRIALHSHLIWDKWSQTLCHWLLMLLLPNKSFSLTMHKLTPTKPFIHHKLAICMPQCEAWMQITPSAMWRIRVSAWHMACLSLSFDLNLPDLQIIQSWCLAAYKLEELSLQRTQNLCVGRCVCMAQWLFSLLAGL